MKKIITKTLAVSLLALAMTGCREVKVDGNNHWVSQPFRLLPDNPDHSGTEIIFDGAISTTETDSLFPHGVIHSLEDGSYTYFSHTGDDVTIDFEIKHRFSSADGTLIISNMSADPLYDQQWHLNNTGQAAFSQDNDGMSQYIQWAKSFFGLSNDDIANRPDRYTFNPDRRVAGEDINLLPVHARGYTGKGIVVAVTDSGLEADHEDLALNFRDQGSYDFTTPGSSDPTNRYDTQGDHGTSVAGLIGAVAGNMAGGRGVAPETTLLGQNFLLNQSDEALAIIHGMTGDSDVDIINKSWGFTLFLQSNGIFHNGELDSYIDAYPALNLRNGLGASVVKAAGNSFNASDLSDLYLGYGLGYCENNGAIQYGLTCANAAINSGNNHPWQIVVGGVNADGTHTSYSTAGSALWASAPAGEYGFREPAMITTDQSGCEKGYSGSLIESFYFNNYAGYPYGAIYPLNGINTSVSAAFDPNCNYVQTFNGTSSAAPNMSGVIALMLDANKQLTWRDIKHIIASTADKVEPQEPDINISVAAGQYIAHDGWVNNGAGFSFNNHFGFGRINAGKAVHMAKDYHSQFTDFSQSDWVDVAANLTIPDNNPTGASHTLHISDSGTIEAVQIRVTVSNSNLKTLALDNTLNLITSSTVGSDTAIELTSPAGTKSIMMSARTGVFASYDWGIGLAEESRMYQDMILLSNAFYGEQARGHWTIRLIDTNGEAIPANHPSFVFLNNEQDSILDTWGITFFGQNFKNKHVGEG